MSNIIITRPNQGGSSASVFGSGYHYDEDLGMTTTNGVVFVEKLRLTTGALIAGSYRINWSFQWNHNAQNSDFEGTVILDSGSPTDYLAVYKQEPKDSGAAPQFVDIPANTIVYDGLDGVGPGQNYVTSGTAQRFEYSGYAVKPLTAGVHDVTINFRSDELGDESSVWNARLELWRVS